MSGTRTPPFPLILASGSPYRRQLLERFGLEFTVSSPDVDESPQANESALTLSQRLARAKAAAIAHSNPQAIVIGSDQVLACGEELLGKPGNHANAVAQLQRLSGQSMTFYSTVCVMHLSNQYEACAVVLTQVRFRELTLSEIEGYLAVEPAYDCAGSCKAEGLGISLCASVQSDDPTALIGLPLIRLADMLRATGIPVPASR